MGRDRWRHLAGLTLLVALVTAIWPGRATADMDDALRALEGGQDARALKELAPLAAVGSPSARYLLGFMRETGRGGPADPAQAARLYRQAADGGNVPAMVALGRLYILGRGVDRNDARANALLRRAADEGSARALYLLGMLRLENRGGPAADAPRYLRRAIRAGSPEAAAMLGELLLAGRGVARDPAQAYQLALTALAGTNLEPATRARLTTLAASARKQLDPTVAVRLEGRAGKPSAAAKRAARPEADHRVRTGTGFVVSRLGHVLTNAHVAAGCGRLFAVLDGRRVPASLVRVDRDDDLALLRLAEAPAQALLLREGEGVQPGASVYAVGYPGRRAVTGQVRITSGRIRLVAQGGRPAGRQAVTAEVLPGNSGGPLLDASGHVVGVVTARRDTEAAQKRLGDAPAEMGFVIALPVVRAFLAKGQIPIRTTPSGRVLDRSALLRSVSQTVLPLFCLPEAEPAATR